MEPKAEWGGRRVQLPLHAVAMTRFVLEEEH
jgi:hypothetical protein